MATDDDIDGFLDDEEIGPKGDPGDPAIATLHEAIAAAQSEVNKVYERRWAAIEAAIRANIPRLDDKFDPMLTPRLARAFIDLMENGLEGATTAEVHNIRSIN